MMIKTETYGGGERVAGGMSAHNFMSMPPEAEKERGKYKNSKEVVKNENNFQTFWQSLHKNLRINLQN